MLLRLLIARHRSGLLVERTGVHDLLGGLLAAKHNQQVGHRRCLTLFIEFDDAALLEPLQGELDHADGAFDDPLTSGYDGARLLLCWRSIAWAISGA